MHRRQKLGLTLGTTAAVICAGQILLKIAYDGENALLSTWRDNPFLIVASILAGMAALCLTTFSADDSVRPRTDRQSRETGSVAAGILPHALMTMLLLVTTFVLVGMFDQPFDYRLTILWILDGVLWLLQGLYGAVFGFKAESTRDVGSQST